MKVPRRDRFTHDRDVPIRRVRSSDDTATHAIVAFSGTSMFTIDSATATWSTATTMPFAWTASFGPVGVAYDIQRDTIVVMLGGYSPYQGSAPPVMWTWAGNTSTWTSTGISYIYPWSRWALTYDSVAGHVLAIGGELYSELQEPSIDSVTQSVYAWDGTSWSAQSITLPAQHAEGEAWFDPGRGAAFVAGGSNGYLQPFDPVWQLGMPSVDRTPPHPSAVGFANGTGPVADDPARHRQILVRLSSSFSSIETWTWDGVWHLLAPPHGPTHLGAIAYDPVRGGVVMVEPSTQLTWLLGDDDWQQIATGTPISGGGALGYDYANRRLVVAGNDTSVLSSDATTWTQINPGFYGGASEMAYDASTGHLVALTAAGQRYDLVADAWVANLSPGPNYQLVEDLTRGSIRLVPASAIATEWERRGGNWVALGPPGVAMGAPIACLRRPDDGVQPIRQHHVPPLHQRARRRNLRARHRRGWRRAERLRRSRLLASVHARLPAVGVVPVTAPRQGRPRHPYSDPRGDLRCHCFRAAGLSAYSSV